MGKTGISDGRAAAPRFSYDEVVEGTTFAATTMRVTAEMVRSYLLALGEERGEVLEGDLIPALVLANPLMRAHYSTYQRKGESSFLHAKQSFVLRSQPRVGELVSISGHIQSKSIVKDRPRIVCVSRASGEDGRELLVGEQTFVSMWNESGAHVGVKKRPGAPELEDSAAAGTVRGADGVADRPGPFPVVSRTITQDMILAFTGAENTDNIHSSREVAQAHGLRTTIAQGMMFAAFAEEYGADVLGEGFRSNGTINLAFVGPLFEGEELQLVGRADSIGDTTVGPIEVECRADNRRRVAIGTIQLSRGS